MKRVVVATVFVATSLLLTGCLYPGQHAGPVDQNTGNLGGVRFWQQQAVLGFDTSSYTLSDTQVDGFRDLLDAHEVDPGHYRAPDTEGCTGGVTTRVQMWFHDNGDKEMIIDGCGADDGSFEQQATEFFTAIHDGSDAPSPGTTPADAGS